VSDYIKYFYIYSDNYLKLEAHIDEVCNKIKKTTYKFTQQILFKILKIVYMIIVESIMFYLVFAWVRAYNSYSQKFSNTHKLFESLKFNYIKFQYAHIDHVCNKMKKTTYKFTQQILLKIVYMTIV